MWPRVQHYQTVILEKFIEEGEIEEFNEVIGSLEGERRGQVKLATDAEGPTFFRELVRENNVRIAQKLIKSLKETKNGPRPGQVERVADEKQVSPIEIPAKFSLVWNGQREIFVSWNPFPF